MKQLLKISEFSYRADIKRKNLIFYDQVGLLKPAYTAPNGYRYYAYSQLETVSVICALQEMGMSLKDIRQYLDERSPAALVSLFSSQQKLLEQKIQKLKRIKRMVATRLRITTEGLHADSSALSLQRCEKEALFASEEAVASTEEAFMYVMDALYERCAANHMTNGYPLCHIIPRRNLLAGQVSIPTRCYFKYPPEENRKPWMYKPAGLYITGFEWVPLYETPQVIYKHMFTHMKKHGLTIAGDAYEELLLDEIAVQEPGMHLMKISMQVEAS